MTRTWWKTLQRGPVCPRTRLSSEDLTVKRREVSCERAGGWTEHSFFAVCGDETQSRRKTRWISRPRRTAHKKHCKMEKKRGEDEGDITQRGKIWASAPLRTWETCWNHKHPEHNMEKQHKTNYTHLKCNTPPPLIPSTHPPKKKRKAVYRHTNQVINSLPAAGSTGRETGKSILQQVLKKHSHFWSIWE